MTCLPLLLTLFACRSDTKAVYTEDEATTIVLDQDGDGYLETDDCDDNNALINSGSEEICDGVDNNCDGQVDEGVQQTFYQDEDGDGFGDSDSVNEACSPPSGTVPIGNDCDDTNADIFPGAPEVCDETDNNCDGVIDEEGQNVFYLDADGDGFGDPLQQLEGCAPEAGYVENLDDCDDSNAAVHPLAPEICNGFDDNCNDLIDSVDPNIENPQQWFLDYDEDGYGNPDFSEFACEAPLGYVDNSNDCDDLQSTIFPGATEICDELDNNCDGTIDEAVTTLFYLDADGDGYGFANSSLEACSLPSGYAENASDCNDSSAVFYPGAPELCDNLDNNCDGSIDEDIYQDWYLDYDGDGYGDSTLVVNACAQPSTLYTTISGDCNDLDSTYYPSAPVGCDDNDYDCDGAVDNDADGDGYADSSCGGTDCDDTDPLLYPSSNNLCAQGESCADILDRGTATGDGEYWIDTDGYNTGNDPFMVYCDMTLAGGGWTLIARSDPLQSLWSTSSVLDELIFGDLANGDFKSPAWNEVNFTDVMFEDGTFHAVYAGIGSGNSSWYAFQATIPLSNCAIPDGYEYAMTEGNFAGGQLCSTNLYIHPTDNDGGGPSYCYPDYIYSDNASGPTWSTWSNGSCPLDDPSGTTFIYRSGRTPWSTSMPLLFYVR